MAIKLAQRNSLLSMRIHNIVALCFRASAFVKPSRNGGAQHWDLHLPARYRPADHVQLPDAISTLRKGSVATHKQSGGKGKGVGGPFILQDLFLGLFEFGHLSH